MEYHSSSDFPTLSEGSRRYIDVLGASLPVDERAALRNLSPNEVPAWADARVEEYQRRNEKNESHIATFRTLRNTQSPINELPPELLGRILAEGYSTPKDIRIVQVCRHWNAVAMSTPQFFANALENTEKLCSYPPPSRTNFLRIALQRSGRLPLHLQVVDRFSEHAWTLLSIHASRVHSLTVRVCSNYHVTALAKALSSGTLHALRSLQVASYGRWILQRLSIDDAGRCLPRLRELSIHGELFTSTFMVSTLQELTITGSTRETPSDFARGLKRCSDLKFLNLFGSIPGRETKDFEELRTVTLPRLQEFVLRDSPGRIHNILARLSLPLTTSISINVDFDARRTVRDAIPHNYMQRFHEKPLIDHMYINYKGDIYYFHTAARCYAGAEERLHIATRTGGEDSMHGLLDVLLEACEHGAPVSTLTLYGSSPDFGPWSLLLKRLPRLRRLELRTGSRTPIYLKMHFATTFLNTCGSQESQGESSGLTLAWVVLLDEKGIGGGVLSELGHLASMLEGCRRCARLELYGMKPSNVTFRSLAEIPTDPTRLRTIAAPILPQLSGLVDVLTIH